MNEIAEEQELPSIADQLRELDKDIREALKPLNHRQTAFVRGLAEGLSQEKAALKAGYSASTAKSQASRLLTKVGVVSARDLMKWQNQLRYGIDSDHKRAILLDIAANQRDKQPRAAVSAVNELNRMDGGHKPVTSINIQDTKVTISYDLQMPSRGNILEGQTGELPTIGSGHAPKPVAIANDDDSDAG